MREKNKGSWLAIDMALGDCMRMAGSGVPLPCSASPAEVEGQGKALQRGAGQGRVGFPAAPP